MSFGRCVAAYATAFPPERTTQRSLGWFISIPVFDTYGATSLFTTVGDLLKWEQNFDAPHVGDRRLLDEMQIHVAPILLGDGTRLFDNDVSGELELVRTIASPAVTHLRYRVVR